MSSQSEPIANWDWNGEKLDDAMEWLARSSGLLCETAPEKSHQMITAQIEGKSWDQKIEMIASLLGIEAEAVTCTYKKLEEMFLAIGPAIIFLPTDSKNEATRFLVLKSSRWGRCNLLTPDLKTVHVPSKKIAELFSIPLATPHHAAAVRLIEMANIPPAGQEKAQNALINSWLNAEVISVGWMLRPLPGASLKILARQMNLVKELGTWLAAFVAQDAFYLASWWFVGRDILSGKMDSGWIWVWILLLISAIPFQLLASWMQNRFSQSVAVLFKQRMIYGILKMDVDELRRMGSGQMLDRVMEIEAVELLALGGGLSALVSFFQLVIAAWVLSLGSSGFLSAGVLALWTVALIGAGWFNYQSGKKWSANYRSMTNGMVEKMIGHRTRLAQENPVNRHDEEDLELVRFQALSHNMDRVGILLGAIPASWLVVGLACLAPSLLSPQPAQLTQIALGLGGILFAYQAFETIRVGIQNDIQLLLSWDQVKPLYHAASRQEESPQVAVSSNLDKNNHTNNQRSSPDNSTRPLLTMHHLIYRYQSHSRPGLDDCNLQIFPGDRIILEGPSGGGKTTLAAVMAGLRRPSSGVILLHGYDLHSLGETTWRKQVMMAPQFNENHIFNETFAFNLLMGKRWPPQPEDIQQAKEICIELGLGELLERMPSSWQQMLGESGWQLSHGERSRVFIARALLQNADLVIMDESFGALDPENLYRALECAYRRAATLLIIAHP